MTRKKTTLVPILGDQLTIDLASLRDCDPETTIVLMMEVDEETTYVRHHKRKIAYILSAMRHHAEALREAGWTVEYTQLDDPDNAGSFTGEIARAVERHDPERIVVTEGGEWRVMAMLESWETLFGIRDLGRRAEVADDGVVLSPDADAHRAVDDRRQARGRSLELR
jgi:deoxyribodipyrimidine photolyase-related protein